MDTMYIKDFETFTHQEAEDAILAWLDQLDTGGVLEFACLDFAYVVGLYLGDRESLPEVSKLLFGNSRRAVWSEISIARMLLLNGFGKVWTGHVEGYPKHMFHVKAVKMVSTSFI